jgi:hypothetical protein
MILSVLTLHENSFNELYAGAPICELCGRLSPEDKGVRFWHPIPKGEPQEVSTKNYNVFYDK